MTVNIKLYIAKDFMATSCFMW